MAKQLIERGIDLNAKTANGETALHFACKAGDIWMVKLLLKNGADVNVEDNEGDTALFHCLDNSNWYNFLVKKGADVRHKDKKGRSTVYKAYYEETRDEDVETLLLARWMEDQRKAKAEAK